MGLDTKTYLTQGGWRTEIVPCGDPALAMSSPRRAHPRGGATGLAVALSVLTGVVLSVTAARPAAATGLSVGAGRRRQGAAGAGLRLRGDRQDRGHGAL